MFVWCLLHTGFVALNSHGAFILRVLAATSRVRLCRRNRGINLQFASVNAGGLPARASVVLLLITVSDQLVHMLLN